MEDRRGYLGGSDIAAAVGMSRWKTRLQLWAEKTGRIDPPDLSDNEAVELGSELEEFVAKKFERKAGMSIRRAPKHYVHPNHSWMRCQVDRLVTGTDELLEVKTTSAWKSKEWEGEEIPKEYILQVQWQLLITGRSVGWIAVLIGGQKFLYKKLPADTTLQTMLLNRAVDFWGMVQRDEAPEATAQDNESLVDIYPNKTEQVQMVEELNIEIARLQELKMHIGELENQQAEIEAKLKQVIGEGVGIMTSKYIAKWSPQVSKRLDTKAVKENEPQIYDKYAKESISRVLRITKNREA